MQFTSLTRPTHHKIHMGEGGCVCGYGRGELGISGSVGETGSGGWEDSRDDTRLQGGMGEGGCQNREGKTFGRVDGVEMVATEGKERVSMPNSGEAELEALSAM